MASANDADILTAATVFLGAAVIAVPLFRRLRLGSVLGYLFAGVLIGPFASSVLFGPEIAGILPDAEQALAVAEFGVVLLLFVIGLELKPERLWRLRGDVFGLGAVQVLLTAAVIGLVAHFTALWVFRLTPAEALVAGLGLALSSTAFAIQILRERGDLATPYGDRAFAVLLFQDLAIVPIFGLVALLAGPQLAEAADVAGEPLWLAVLKAVGMLALLLLSGRFILKPLFHQIALAKADEVFTALALLVVVGSALAMKAVGLSMAMGAFVAGVMLAESEFRHQVETDIEPFRGLFMGLFFMAVGMNLNWEVIAEYAVSILIGGVALVALKAAILYGIARAAGSDWRDALKIAVVLSQGGEFGFFLLIEANNSGVMGAASRQILSATITISMIMTPFLMMLVDWATRTPDDARDTRELSHIENAPEEVKSAPFVIAGFGRTGQVVARILRLRGHPVTLIDNDPRRIQFAQTFGAEVFFGDARRLDILTTAGAAGAKAIILCIDDRDGARLAVERIRERFPKTQIFAMTYDRFSMLEMEKAGAHYVERESFESAISLARNVLKSFGDEKISDDLVAEFRRRDAQLLKLQAEFGAYEGLKKLRDSFSLEKER